MENNIKIAVYMGYTYDPINNLVYKDKKSCYVTDLKYHIEWNWIMPVFLKVAKETTYPHVCNLINIKDFSIDTFYTFVITFLNKDNT